MRNMFISFMALLLWNGSTLGAKNVFQYGPTISTLTGVLQRRSHPGPPNYESVKNGDTEEIAWLLKLPSPISVLDDGKDSFNEAENNIREVQLVIMEDDHFKELKPFMGKSIACTGKLFHRHTGHHHATILMELISHKSE